MTGSLNSSLNICVLGGGGREHALCWKIAQSPMLKKLYCVPGNGGIAALAECHTLDIEDSAAVLDFCRRKHIDLVVIGPEAPLVHGVSDRLTQAGFRVFGPSAEAARLEGSKGFTKDICAAHHIPTADYARFDNAEKAHAYLATHPAPIVIKADGLAAGKGVIIAETDEEAHQAIDKIFGGQFGEAGAEVVIEAFMQGEEASFFVLSDGVHILPLATAQDYKRVGVGDTGPNTGGMGACSPAHIMTPALTEQVLETIIRPTIRAMASAGYPYKGVLYAGLMLTDDGAKLVEYNVRFGDPECQLLMLRLKSDLLPALLAVAEGGLDKIQLDWSSEAAMTIVMANQGYPGAYKKGTRIKNLAEAENTNDVVIFHAGTALDDKTGHVLAMGGRVLNITAQAASIGMARDKIQQAIAKIDWPQGFYRSDIGWRDIAREEKEREKKERK